MNRKLLPLTLFLVLCAVGALASTVSVTVDKSISNISPIEIKASAQSSCCKIDGWYVYVDGQTAWFTHNQVTSIDAYVPVSLGSHIVTVRAWDTTGAYGTVNLTVNVTNWLLTVTSPTSGATMPSPVTFSATASSPNGIDGWEVYANGQTVYSQPNGATLSAQVTLAPATYSVVVRAWDKVSGYVSSPAFNVTVPPTLSLLPTPPATAVVVNNVQNTADSTWTGTSDEAGPTNVTKDFWTACCQSSPSLSGSSREFHVGGPAWTAALFYHKLGNNYDNITHILTDYWIYIDSASLPYVWDMEFDAYQAVGGYEYMMGSHCLLGNTWQGWNQSSSGWVSINAPCPRATWTANAWHHVQWMMERVPDSTKYQYDTLVVDGVAYPLNVREPAGVSDWGSVLGVQWQIDTNGTPGSVNWWIDKVTVTLW